MQRAGGVKTAQIRGQTSRINEDKRIKSLERWDTSFEAGKGGGNVRVIRFGGMVPLDV